MSISVNKSPLAGREGKLLQSRVIRDRLFKELDRNVALKVRVTPISELSHHHIFLVIVVDWLHVFESVIQ
jgi:predicted membrane GTPase involved in stress response